MPLTAYFVRHGESRANVDRIFANRPDQPAPLTMTGTCQAWKLALALARLDPTHIYTSPLERARQTAEAIGAHVGLLPMVRDALREYDVGDFEGLGYGAGDAWRWDACERVDAAWRRGERRARLPGGESLDDIAGRFLPFVHRLAATHASDDRLVIVSHGGIYRLMLPLLLADISPDDDSFRHIGYCDVVAAQHRDLAWRCISRSGTPPAGPGLATCRCG